MKEGEEMEFVGDFVIVWGANGSLQSVLSYYANNLMPFPLDNASGTGTERGISTAMLDKYLLVSYPDGTVKTLYFVPWGVIITVPNLSSGTVSCEGAYIKDPRPGISFYAKPTIELSLGGET